MRNRTNANAGIKEHMVSYHGIARDAGGELYANKRDLGCRTTACGMRKDCVSFAEFYKTAKDFPDRSCKHCLKECKRLLRELKELRG